MSQKRLIALIPARSGSERIKNKNLIKIKGKSLLEIAIKNAKKSKIFIKIIVSTDSRSYGRIAKKFGAEVILRPKSIAGSKSPDFDWISYTLKKIRSTSENITHFSILRPTSPFRTHKTILRAWKVFKASNNFESLRAVELFKQHPFKMWSIKKKQIQPLFKKKIKKQPAYNMQFKSLPKVYIQNASLEISKIDVIKKYKSITGKKILPFFTKNHEGFDINYKEDIYLARQIANKESL